MKSGWLRSAACRALSCRLQSCATAGHSTTLCSTPHPWMRPKKMPLAGVGSTRAVRACSWQVARVGKRVVRGRMRTDARGRELGVSRLQLGDDVVRRDGQPCPSRRSTSLKNIMLSAKPCCALCQLSGHSGLMYGKLKTLPEWRTQK